LIILLLGITDARLRGLQSGPQTGSPSETAKCVIQGVVTEVPTGAPSKGAEVVLTAENRYSRSLYRSETDATGQFSLSDIEPGKYQIWIRKTAYESPRRQCDSDKVQEGDELTLVSGQKLSGLKFQLLSPAVITGAVFDPSGDPLTGAEVQAVRFYSYDGDLKLSSATRGTTDDRGQFRLFHLAPGWYFLRIEDAFDFRNRFVGHEDPTAKGMKGFLPIYYPDTTDLREATLFQIEPGEELRGVDFTIHPAQVLRIRGHAVNGLTGERINDGTVAAGVLPPAIPENRGASISLDQEGQQFTIDDLVPGRYIVSVDAFVLPDRKRWGGWQEIDLTDSSLDDILIKAFPGHDLVGHVQAIGGKKLDSTGLQVILEPRGDLAYGYTFANAKTDGSFLLFDVKQDTYEINVAGLPEGYYLKSARFGNIEVLEDGLRIVGDSSTLPLVLEASPAGGQVDGTVQMANGKSACNATVVLIPDANRRAVQRYYQETEVDRFGRFAVRGIAPGAYKLFAFDDVHEVGYRDSASLQAYENQGQSAQIGEGDHRTIELKLIPTGK
jgi:hypothetical protein